MAFNWIYYVIIIVVIGGGGGTIAHIEHSLYRTPSPQFLYPLSLLLEF